MKFSLFLLGVLICIGLSSACKCTANYDPVCGTDDKTYSNKCALGCARLLNPSIRVKNEGPCIARNSYEGGQKSGNAFRPSTRPYIYGGPGAPPPIITTRRPSYVPLPSPRPNGDRYTSQSQQSYTSPPFRPTQNYESPPFRPTTRPGGAKGSRY